jgi:hypothetical protein
MTSAIIRGEFADLGLFEDRSVGTLKSHEGDD